MIARGGEMDIEPASLSGLPRAVGDVPLLCERFVCHAQPAAHLFEDA